MACDEPYPSVKEKAFFQGLPFDYGVVFDNAIVDRLFSRLRQERALVEGGLLARPDHRPWRLGAVITEADSLDRRLSEQIRCLSGQSLPVASIALVTATNDAREAVSLWASVTCPPNVVVTSDPRAWMVEADLDLVVVFAPGALAHPGLFAALGRALQRDGADFAVWNHLLVRRRAEAPGQDITYLRCPDPTRQPVALAHMEAAGPAWAATPGLFEKITGDLGTALIGMARHPLSIALLGGKPKVVRLNEFLGACRVDSLGTPPWPRQSALVEAYGAALEDETFRLEIDPAHPTQPIRLTPRRRAHSIDVVISFRDKPELTLAAMGSIYAQTTKARVSLFLIDNQSTPAARAVIDAEAARAPAGINAQVLSYDRPFNHSAQTNLGAAAGNGEALVFMSNDCALVAAGTLDEMAAWALAPGVGTVGVRLETAEGRLACSGICALYPDHDFHPIITEGFDQLGAGLNRETFANTFACASLARAVFRQAGPLNAVDFPVGLNDVEYCLRLRDRGLRHVYLGAFLGRHQALGSQRASDDGAQSAILRQTYGHLLFDKEYMLEYDFLRQFRAAKLRADIRAQRDNPATF